ELVRVAENDREDVIKVVRDTAGQRAETFHFLRLDQLLLETLSLGVVEKINVEIGKIALREISNKTRDDINRVAVALPHFQFVPIDHPVVTNHYEQLDAVLPAAQE